MLEALPSIEFNHPIIDALFHSNTEPFAYFDANYSVREYNRLFKEVLHLEETPKQLQHLPIFNNNGFDLFKKHFEQASKEGFVFSRKIVFEDGTILIVEIKVIPVFESGVLKGGFICLNDLTSKESTQIAMKAIAQNYSDNDISSFYKRISYSVAELFNVPLIFISSFDKQEDQFRIEHVWSETGKSIVTDLTYNQSELVFIEGKDPCFFTYTDAFFVKMNLECALKMTDSKGVLFFNKAKEVMGCMTICNAKPIKNESLIEELLPVIAEKISHEIFYSKEHEKLQDQEQLFRNLYKESPLGIMMICNSKAKIMHANPMMCRMLGYAEKEIKQLTAYDITHPEDRNKHKNKFEKSAKQDYSAFDFKKRYIKKDGSIIWVNIAASVVLDAKGNPLNDLAAVQDITEKHKAEELIKEQIETLNMQNQKLEKYIDSNLQLENFAYIASHDLKAPLRTIGNFAQLLNKRIKHSLSEDEKDYMEYILEGTKDMNRLIEDLLIYSKIKSSENVVVDLNFPHILNNVCRNLDATIKESNAKIIIEDIPENLVANKTKLTQLLQNLIANGIKFQEENKIPEIRISGFENDNLWQIKIADNGIGIEPQYFDQIFTLFKRLHGKSEFDGSGIGLAYCKQVVEKHGGKIWLESEIGKGTVFYFTIKKSSKGTPMVNP